MPIRRAGPNSSSMCRATCRPSSRKPCAPPSGRCPTRPSTSPRLPSRSRREADKTNPNIVKVVGSPFRQQVAGALFHPGHGTLGQGAALPSHRALRYRRNALARFVSLAPSTLEKRESLEQLRALEAGMRIDAEIVDSVPLGVDTPAELEKARAFFVPRTMNLGQTAIR